VSSCNNECGNNWCCRHILGSTDKAGAKLLQMRNFKVYRDGDRYLCIGTKKCRHLKDGKCKIYMDRPDVCKGFPNSSDVSIVPKACPLKDRATYVLEDLEEVKL